MIPLQFLHAGLGLILLAASTLKLAEVAARSPSWADGWTLV